MPNQNVALISCWCNHWFMWMPLPVGWGWRQFPHFHPNLFHSRGYKQGALCRHPKSLQIDRHWINPICKSCGSQGLPRLIYDSYHVEVTYPSNLDMLLNAYHLPAILHLDWMTWYAMQFCWLGRWTGMLVLILFQGFPSQSRAADNLGH